MKPRYLTLYLLVFGLFSAFKPSQACDYADSNMGYVKMEIEKAISMKDLQLVRFHTYKALNAIAKSKKQLDDCGCEYAATTIAEGTEHLKQATKATSLASSAILLKKALNETIESLYALKDHSQHNSTYGNELVMNTSNSKKKTTSAVLYRKEQLQKKIDSSLVAYRRSIAKVVKTINCEEARKFANRIYDQCELQLLKPNLSEGKKYYNLKTKEITAEALEKLGDCK